MYGSAATCIQAGEELKLDPSTFDRVHDMKNRSNSAELDKAGDVGRSEVEAGMSHVWWPSAPVMLLPKLHHPEKNPSLHRL